jgi:putative transposase
MAEELETLKLEELLKDENYGLDGEFCLTIVTGNENFTLSRIEGKKIVLTEAGKIVEEYLNQAEDHFSNVTIKDVVIMPNCLHALVEIDSNASKKRNFIVHDISRFEISFGLVVGRKNPFMLKGSIFHLISWFKAASLLELRKNVYEDFTWKSGYYDFKIKDRSAEKKVKEYLKKSAVSWPLVKENPHEGLLSYLSKKE